MDKKMDKYVKEEDLKKYLNKQKKMAEEEQKKHGRCDEQQDAYWQGYIDIIDTLAEDLDIEPLWC